MEKDINKEHELCVFVLGALSGNRLLSCRCFDSLVLVWTVSDVNITISKEINKHNCYVRKVI